MNQLKKKRSLLSVLKNNQNIQTVMGVIVLVAFLIATYWIGKLELYVEKLIFHNSIETFYESILGTFMIGIITELLCFAIVAALWFIIEMFIYSIRTIKVAKILQFLPVSEEEIKLLNIASYESFEDFLVSLFKDAPKEISNGASNMVELALFETIVEYLKFDDAIGCEFYDPTTGDIITPKAEFARLRSETLTKYLFKNEELSAIENTIEDVKRECCCEEKYENHPGENREEQIDE